MAATADDQADDASEPDFLRLWAAYSASELGSAIGMGALPLVAVLVLRVASWQVSLLAALSGLVGVVLALPAGPAIEHRRKRPVMMAADLVRALALASVPVAAALHVLTYPQLCLVGMVSATGAICFSAASGAHLKSLVPAPRRPRANSRFEMTFWTAQTLGAPVGGLLVQALGATATMAVDAVSYVLSALGVGSIRAPEPTPPDRVPGRRFSDVTAGWRYIGGHRVLRRLLACNLLFNGAIFMCSPIMSVFELRELQLRPWQFGVTLGIPALGGLLGARLMPRLHRRFGEGRLLRGAGVARTLFLAVPAAAPRGLAGMVLIVLADFLVLVFAGMYNPTQVGLRQREVADGFMARVGAAWSMTSRLSQPVGAMLGAGAVALAGLRGGIVVAGAVSLLSAVVLLWPQGAGASGSRSDGGVRSAERQAPGRQAPAPPRSSVVSRWVGRVRQT